jgi:phosphatidylglycerophosphate synthase
MPYFGSYLTVAGAKQLLLYKYKGSDDSIVLKYITDPLYTKWVTYFPTWLAPNLVTLTGLAFTAISHALLAYYCPNLEGPIPTWLCVYNAFAILAYQAFDAMDGKHARRTGSGSPLGLLFDHGCDAINTTVMAISCCCALDLGPTMDAALLAWLGWAGFFMGTLEEYYTGELYLGVINMPNEGLQITAVAHLAAAFLPAGWWREPVAYFGGVQRNRLAIYLVAVPAAITTLYNTMMIIFAVKPQVEVKARAQKDKAVERMRQASSKVREAAQTAARKVNERRRSTSPPRPGAAASSPAPRSRSPATKSPAPSARTQPAASPPRVAAPVTTTPVSASEEDEDWATSFPLFVALTRCIPLLVVFIGFLIWMAYSPSDIIGRHPRLMLWTIGLAKAKLVTQMMLAHLCNEEYHPFGKTIAALVVLQLNAMVALALHLNIFPSLGLGKLSWDVGHEYLQLYLCFAVLLASYVHLVWSVVSEVSKALGIYAFTITRKRPAKKSKAL